MPQLKNLIAVMRFACIYDISFQRLYPNYFQVMTYFIFSYSSWSVKYGCPKEPKGRILNDLQNPLGIQRLQCDPFR